MPYTRAGRGGCGGLIVRIVTVMMLAIVALVLVANRSWVEGKVLNRLYDGRPEIHAGKHFRPGATAVEDGVTQTAVLIHGEPHVRVSSPTALWRADHKDATCHDGVCTAAATRKSFSGGGGVDLVGIGAVALVIYLVWVLLVDNDNLSFVRGGGRGRGYGRSGRYDGYDR